MYNVVVIGAGLAGLAAAYELSKHPQYRITVLEQRNRVGGRVHAVSINGQMVDLGGFIVYSWYKEFHRLLTELGLADQLKKIPLHDVYYQIDDSGKYYTEKEVPFSKKDTAMLSLKMAKPILQASDVAEPPLDNFAHLTGSAYLRRILKRPDHAGVYETWSDVVSQGYGYPPVDQFKMSFIAPFIRRTHFGDDVAKWYYLPNGAGQLPLALADEITKAGHTIQLNTTVTDVTALSADYIISAQTASCPYTPYYTAVIQLSGELIVNDDSAWGATFYLPNKAALQITSAVHLRVLYGLHLSGLVNCNIVVRDDQLSHLTATTLFEHIRPELLRLFPGTTPLGIVQLERWSQTMPCADEELVQQIRKQQGKNGRYYAGDWLGAPSMETALVTGVRAAQRIVNDYT